MRDIAATRAATVATGAGQLREYLALFSGSPGDADVRRRLERIDTESDEALSGLEQTTNAYYNLLLRAKRGDRRAYSDMERIDESEAVRVRARVDQLKGEFSESQMARLARIEARGMEGQRIVQQLQEAERTTVVSRNAEASSSNTSDRQFDRFLNEYEKFVNQYVSVMKRVSRGDMTAMQKYPALYQKAVNAQRQLEGVRGDLSMAQMNRYIRLQTKLANGAAQ